MISMYMNIAAVFIKEGLFKLTMRKSYTVRVFYSSKVFSVTMSGSVTFKEALIILNELPDADIK